MRRLGVHTSIAGGLYLSLERAKKLGCNTVQIFSHNPRGWILKPIPDADIEKFKALRKRFDITPVYIHTSYLINMASKDRTLRRKSIAMLAEEMEIADRIGADYLILHSGSASREDERIARKRAISSLNEVSQSGRWNTGLLIENTAGERGDISSTMENLYEIMIGVRGQLISGVCIDTCHAFAAGYDVRDERVLKSMVHEIKRYIGIDMVKLIHLNDSKGDIGSRIDRHEHIGFGKIGKTGLEKFIHYPFIKNISLILETPKKSESDDMKNLKAVKKMMKKGH